MRHTATLWSQGGRGAEQAARALRIFCANVIDKPAALKYRRIKAAGAAFSASVAACPGALDVLQACGFVRQQHWDGAYWVLHRVDEPLLRQVRAELDAGLTAFSKLREDRGQSFAHMASSASGMHYDSGVPATAVSTNDQRHIVRCTTSAISTATQRAAEPKDQDVHMRRQLQARAIVHRVSAQQQRVERERASRYRQHAAGLALAIVMLAVAAVWVVGSIGSESGRSDG